MPNPFEFGTGSSTPFGQPNQLFGGTSSGFGSGSFGFGSSTQPIFGNTQQTAAPLFGSTTTPPFGQSNQIFGFGNENRPIAVARRGKSRRRRHRALDSSLSTHSQELELCSKDTAGSSLFESSQQPSCSSGIFGPPARTCFGFPSLLPFGPFGQNAQTQQQTAPPMFSVASFFFGGTTIFGTAQTQTGTVNKFVPAIGTDQVQKSGVLQTNSTKHHCITFMKEYENKSLEELRREYYQANRKALECGNIEIALETAKALNDKSCWDALAETALMHGNHQVVEICYKKTKSFDKLCFLYLITGNLDKLRKLTKIAEIAKDRNVQYHGALLLGDIEERVRILKDINLHSLAYLTAATHGMEEEAEKMKETFKDKPVPDIPANAKYLKPPVPIQQAESNWPLLTINRGSFESASLAKATNMTNLEVDPNIEAVIDEGKLGDDDDEIDDEDNEVKKKADVTGDGEPGWDVEDADLEIPNLDQVPQTTTSGYVHLPSLGPSPQNMWFKVSQLLTDHITARSFRSAGRLLNEQIGVVNFPQYSTLFLNIFTASKPRFPWQQNSPPQNNCTNRILIVNLKDLVQRLQACYQLTTGCKFTEAIERFQELLLQITLLMVDTKQEISEVEQLLKICKEYILGLKMETLRESLPKNSAEEQKRQCEMAAYITHCNLQPIHQILTLATALNIFFKTKNYKTASSFAKRLLELGPTPEVAEKVRKILQACDTNMNDELQLQYDEHNPFSLCGISYKPIYRGKPEEKCPLCKTSYLPEFKGHLCNVCCVAEIGKECSRLKISTNH